MSTTESEINAVLTFLRSNDINLQILENKIKSLKTKISKEEYNKIIGGCEERSIGTFKYKIININNKIRWCLLSQIEYEHVVKKNKKFNKLYQTLKTVYI
tara:strand:- start:201 stop:500 length:300 start_codon:yes stop_codon:yes gene_type:complete